MEKNILIAVIAIAALIGGFALILNGKMIGVLLLLAAFAIGVFHVMKARNAAGYTNDDVGFNGIDGTGRQQSEVTKKEKDRI